MDFKIWPVAYSKCLDKSEFSFNSEIEHSVKKSITELQYLNFKEECLSYVELKIEKTVCFNLNTII